MTDWHERMLETGLEEVFGGAAAPSAGRLHLLRAPASAPAHQRWIVGALLVAAAALVAVLVWPWSPEPGVGGGAPVPIRLDVTEGALVHVPSPERTDGTVPTTLVPLTLNAPGSAIVVVAERDTLRVPAKAGPVRFSIGGCTALVAAPGTHLEVLAMKRIESRGAVVVGALTLGVITGAVSWSLFGGTASAKSGDKIEVALAGLPPQVARELEGLRRRNDDLKRRLDAAERRVDRRALPADSVRPQDPGANEPQPVDTADGRAFAPLFRDGKSDAHLEEVDWEVIGTSVRTALGLFEKGIRQLEEGGELPRELFGDIQMENAKLVRELQEFVAANYEKSGDNGAFTQPIVAANAIAAALKVAGQELSKEQVEGLSRIVELYQAKDRGHERGDRSLMESLFEQAEERRAFFGELNRMLRPEQRNAVTCDYLRDHNMDMFGGNFLLRPFTKPVDSSGAPEFGRHVAFQFEQQMGVQGDVAKQVTRIVDEWARALPKDAFEARSRMENIRQVRVLRGNRTHRAAKRQVELIQRILRDVKLTSEQRRRLLDLRELYVPLPR